MLSKGDRGSGKGEANGGWDCLRPVKASGSASSGVKEEVLKVGAGSGKRGELAARGS